MMGITFEVKYNRLPEVRRRFPVETDRIVRAQLFVTEGDVKINIQKYGAIDTSNMINTVKAVPGGHATGEVVSPAEYSAYVNFGTRYMTGRPFFSDAVVVAEQEFPERFRELESRL